ncbi:MAG: hypothetical protein ACK5IJ_02305 [Mangrovibacterium sp.]
MKNIDIKTIIFWGAAWGICEATLGWFLHLMHVKGEVMILYPFGLLCMMMAAKQTGKSSSIFMVGMVAALIKLVNLFFPASGSIFRTTNPAVAIVIESLLTWGFYAYAQKKGTALWQQLALGVLIVFFSLFVFRGWQTVVDTFFAHNPNAHKPYDVALFQKWSWRALVQGFMLVGAFQVVKLTPQNINFNSWSNRLAFPLLALAACLTVML